MKTIPSLAAALVAFIPLTASAVNTSKHIIAGRDDKTSGPYLTKGPYTLKWTFVSDSKRDKEYAVMAVFVYDEQGKCLGSSPSSAALTGQIVIPKGGTHTVKVIATYGGRYDVWYVDN